MIDGNILFSWMKSIDADQKNEWNLKYLVRGPRSFMKIFWFELDGVARSRSKSENTKLEDARSWMKIENTLWEGLVHSWKYFCLTWMKSLEVDRKFEWKCPTIEMKSMESHS